MTTNDRRSGRERRAVARSKVTVDIEWENHLGRHTGTISDIGRKGCFVLTGGDFVNGETVFLYLPLSTGNLMRIHGEIANNVFEIGFAVKFEGLSETELEFIDNFIAFHAEEG